MIRSYDLLVVGAGPAGASAALAARRHGLKTAILDEARAAGGQIYRAPSYAVAVAEKPANPDLERGETLRSALHRSGADLFFGHRVWFVSPGVQVAAVGPDGAVQFSAPTIVVATGTTERVLPVEGITLPGVVGLAAATILLKAQAITPAPPTVVAGVGPLLYAVAVGILKAGGEVAAVVDLARAADWAAIAPALAVRPDLLTRGLSWMTRLRRAGVPVFSGCSITAIGGAETVEEVEIRPVDHDWCPRSTRQARRVLARSVALGHGLVPATEALQLLGVPQLYRPERGGWVPDAGADRATSVAGVYVAGDCAGISGAAAAEIAGELAGLAAARDVGRLSRAAYEDEASQLQRRLARAERFGSAISRLMTLRPGLVRAISGETVVCRCEDLTRTAIDRATAAGARHLSQLKSTTRCGMGPCQGRMCGEAAAELMAFASGRDRATVGQWAARTPIRPVPLAAMVGAYDYDDIPKPVPAPA